MLTTFLLLPMLWMCQIFTYLNHVLHVALVFGAGTGPLLSMSFLPSSLKWLKVLGSNLGFFTVTLYSVYYAALDPIAAVRTVLVEESNGLEELTLLDLT
jgi:hypothetical protein